MTLDPELSVEERLVRLFQHLGIAQAHIAACRAADWQGPATAHPDLVASLTLVCPPALDPSALHLLASRLFVVTGDQGPAATRVRQRLTTLPEATSLTLREYVSLMWSDVIADRGADIGTGLLAFLHRMEQGHPSPAARLPEGEGEVAGLSYRIRGAGPPLVLFPLELAPSQWEPLLPMLSAHYCTITLGGAALGIVAVLEARSRGGYLGVVRSLLDAVQVQPGEVILDVGCGSGAVTRWVARQTGGANHLVGVDINAYVLREATALARREGLGDAITFQEGNAEALPWPEQSFDVSLACTVLEEGDADRMLAELVRVTKPGGRVGVIVRAVDMPRWVNLPLSASLKAKVDAPGLIGAGVGPQGCADASLYRRLATAGLTRLTAFPQLATVTPAEPLRLASQQQQLLATLSPEEAREWRHAVGHAEAEDTFFVAQPHHCAVGTKS
jgi:SAM-dependent methyltransferase